MGSLSIKNLVETLLKKVKYNDKAQIDKLKVQLGAETIKMLLDLAKKLSIETEQEKMLQKELIGRKALAKILKVHEATIKYYSDLKLIPFVAGATEGRKRRYFEMIKVRKRLNEIGMLQKKGYKIEDLVEYYKR